MGKRDLDLARQKKNDEFYTRLEDIEEELAHYRPHFRDKVVYLNCDDPERSNFWRYFVDRFDELGLRRLVATHYTPGSRSYALSMERGASPVRTEQDGDGDFRSPECVELLDSASIVVSNPPFSLFREYIDLLVSHGKDFLIIGNMHAVSYMSIFPLIQDGTMHLGVRPMNAGMWFEVPEGALCDKVIDGSRIKNVQACWYTTLDHGHRNEPIPLVREYSADLYPRYDNLDAIEVGKVADIPRDYPGVMGVPITYLGRYCPEQFEMVGFWQGGEQGRHIGATKVRVVSTRKQGWEWWNGPALNGRARYARILIRRVDGSGR